MSNLTLVRFRAHRSVAGALFLTAGYPAWAARRRISALGKKAPCYIGGMTERRRFPPPWSVEETVPCFILRDANRQALAYVYCEDEPGRRAATATFIRSPCRPVPAARAISRSQALWRYLG